MAARCLRRARPIAGSREAPPARAVINRNPAMDRQTREAFLRTIPIFAGLEAAPLTSLASAAQEVSFTGGDLIVKEGEPGDRMYIIHTGQVRIVKDLGGLRETSLALLGPGDFLGEMSIIECVTRSASVLAMGPTQLFALKGMDLYRLFQRRPDQYAVIMLNIARDLSRRLRAVDEKFAAISH